MAKQTDLSIDALCKAIQEMERGLIDANLGGGIVKKRVAPPGRAKAEVPEHWWQQTNRSLVLYLWF